MTQSALPRVPRSVDDITAQWLTTVLRCGNQADPTVTVTDVRAEQFAQDRGFASQLYRLHLSGDDGVPDTVVAKLPARQEVREAISGIGGYQREMMFYQQLSGHAPLAAPRTYGAFMATDSEDFVLLLEDLRGWENGDHLAGLSLDRIKLCLRHLAAMHAWSLTGPTTEVLSAFPRIDGAVAHDLFVPMFEFGWKIYREKTNQSVPPAVARYAERFTSHAMTALTIMAEQSVLLHGDSRADNIFFDGSEVKFIDFQFMARGSGATDVAYLISQSLPTSERRGHDEGLVRHYLEHLAAHSAGAYRFDDVWRQYRAAAAYWIVIPTILLTGWDTMSVRSRALCMTLVDRAVAAIADVAAYEVVA